MDTPRLDSRDRNDILEQLRTLASSYVPEWRWDDRNPDAGVVLAHLYAEMMENTISKYNRTAHNHYLTFLNMLGTRLLPPSPAEGLVSVGVIPGTDGVYIDRGTPVYAAADTETGRTFYETTEAVNALDAEIDRIFFTSVERDSIVCAYERGQENGPVRLFGFDVYPEKQKHVLYFRDDAVFYTKDRVDITLNAVHSRSARLSRRLPELLGNPDAVTWEYHSQGQWLQFDRVLQTEKGVRLIGEHDSTPVESEAEGKQGLIRCRINRIPAGGVFVTDVSWTSSGAGLQPDSLSGSSSELTLERFSPFGDIVTLFSDFNISNREAFSKAGATIDIDFELDYFKTPIERAGTPEDNIRYRSIMTDEDFPKVRERDVQIERVLWEYWNGLGWARLFPSGQYEDFFTPGKERKPVRRLSFQCPPDMQDLTLGASSGPFIRARVDKLSSMNTLAGNYISPFVHKMSISYHYDGNPVECRQVLVESNAERTVREFPVQDDAPVVTASLCPDPAMYLCLTGPLTGGPIRIFWDIGEGVYPDPAPLLWEYYGVTVNGTPGWKSIEVMDMTDNATKSGIVTLVGKRDFVKACFFGSDGYFIRLVDSDRRYDRSDSRKNPLVNGIWFNTVPVVQRERRQPEYFYIARGERTKTCILSAANVSDVRVWVNEQGSLSAREEERLLGMDGTIVARSAEGSVTELWVPWREVERLESAGAGDRAFSVDYASGAVVFGDGRHGRIPPDGAAETIMVRYTVCDGAQGNIEPHAILGFAAKPAQAAWVTNRKRISGGADRETIEQAARRSAGALAGMGRLVTLEDFQRAVLASNRNIRRVKCLAHVDRYNRPREGALALAVLPREYRQGGEQFAAVVRGAREAIAARASMLLTGSSCVDVFEVRYVELCVSADVVISDYNQYHEVYQAISQRLEGFLNPIAGNFNGQGWEIGQLPGRELIYNSIKTIKNIKWIKSLHVFAYTATENGRQAVEFNEARRDVFAVPVFGEPKINLTVE